MRHPNDNKTIDMIDETSRRGRKPLLPAERITDVVDANVLAQATATANAMTATDMALLETSELYMAIGRIQFAHFVETVSARVIAESYLSAKEIFKKIKHLPVRGRDGKTETVSDLDQFCEVALGKTARRCRQHAENLHLLGPELFEQAEAVGLRQRDYAAIKALPDDSRLAVTQAIESGDRSAVIDLVQELAARTEAEKKKRIDAEQTAEARARLLSEATEKNLRLQEKLRNPYTPSKHAAARNEQEKAALDVVQTAAATANKALLDIAQALNDMGEQDGISQSCHDAARNDLTWIAHRLAAVMREHGIELDLAAEIMPSWVRETEAKLADKRTGS